MGAEHVSFLNEMSLGSRSPVPADGSSGEIAGISYRIHGSGDPLVLLPLWLAPSQWDPLVRRLSQEYSTITLGGPAVTAVGTAADEERDPLMDRRAFVGALALGTLSAPRVTFGQATHKVYRIGILNSSEKTSDITGSQTRSSSINALLSGLQGLGYVYGRDFVTEPRGGGEQARALFRPRC
jgi:hypothetical protein